MALHQPQHRTPEAERELLLAARTGDERRRAELVTAFMPLIATVAQRYRSAHAVERKELMLWVATIGISRAWRDNAKARSSPVGSVSPTVANAWYSSATNSRSRHGRPGCAAIFGMRWSTARWKSSFSITPRIRARWRRSG